MKKSSNLVFDSYKNQIISSVIILLIVAGINYFSYQSSCTFFMSFGIVLASYILYLYSGYISKNNNDDILRLISFILLVLSMCTLIIDTIFESIRTEDFFKIKLSMALCFILFTYFPFIAFLLKNKVMNEEIIKQEK